MGSAKQVLLLLWKNFLVQKRQVVWSVLELVLPLLFTLIIVILRQQVISSEQPEGTFKSFELDGSFGDLIRRMPGERETMIKPCTFFGEQFVRQVFSWNRSIAEDHRVQLYYSPNTTTATSLMNSVAKRFMFEADSHIQIPGFVYLFPKNLKFVNVKGFADEDSMIAALLNDFDASPESISDNYNCSNPFWGGIAFSDSLNFSDANSLEYSIRLSNVIRVKGNSKTGTMGGVDEGWDTKLTFPVVRNPGPRAVNSTDGGKPGYYREGFVTLQKALDTSFIGFVNENFYNNHLKPESVKVDVTKAILDAASGGIPNISKFEYNVTRQTDWVHSLKRFSYASYFQNPFVAVVQRQLTLILMLSLALSVLYITRTVVQEKEQRLKEYMRVMGLQGWVHWLSHFITNWIKLAISMSVVTLLFCISINGKKVLDHADWSLLLVFLWLYAAAAVCFAFAISTFFKGGNTASACAGVAWFLLYLPFFFLQPRYAELTLTRKLLSSLSLNTGVAYGAYIIGIFEGTGQGIQWATFFEPGTVDDNFSMAHVCGMLLVNIALLLIITWYVEAVYPGDEGVPQKFYFPFQYSYWFGNQSKKTPSPETMPPISTISNEYSEEYPKDLQPQVQLRNLSKTFGRGKKAVHAVDGLSLKMYPGQVTALLGHNGAGKSTTVSMLTGLIPPTFGSANIAGFDIQSDLASVRKFLGLCPQYNTLFDNLTVVEHLQLFCKLKNRLYMETEVNRLLGALDMEQKRNALAKTLSGGMKRKLSVAIALIGGSEIVLLDEPTSGMDPGARHEAWTLVQSEKAYRTIILTTHYMEEADLLSDRIAILAKGKLQCCGSALFLKQHYGAGYHVTCLMDKSRIGGNDRMQADAVLQVMKQHCPTAQLQTCVGCEATFLLSTVDKEHFSALFSELEQNKDALKLNSFGVSVSTMEEVFLKVGTLAESESQDGESESVAVDTVPSLIRRNEVIGMKNLQGDPPVASSPVLDATFDLAALLTLTADEILPVFNISDFNCNQRERGVALQLQQFKAMLIKRMLHSARNWLVLVAQLVIPVYCVLSAILINKLLPGPQLMPSLASTLHPFLPAVIPFKQYSPLTNFSGQVSGEYRSLIKSLDGVNVLNLMDTNVTFDESIIALYDKFGSNSVDGHYPVGSEFVGNHIISYFNDQPYHAPPITVNLIDSVLLRLASSSNAAMISTANHPLPPSNKDKLTDWLATGVAEFNIAFNLLFGMAFLSSSFVVFLVKERFGKAKHLQFLSGVHPLNFWAATFVWDFLNYMLPCLCVLALFFIFDENLLVGDGHWAVVLLLLVLYGWSVLPLMYIASFVFDTPAGAFVKLTIFNILSGLVTITVIVVLYMLELENVYNVLRWTFEALFPNFNLGNGFNTFYMNQFIRETCLPFRSLCGTPNFDVPFCCNGGGFTDTPLDWSTAGIGRMLFFLGLQGIVYWMVVFFIEFDWIRHIRYALRLGSFATRISRHNYGTLNDHNLTNIDTESSPRTFSNNNTGQLDNDVKEESVRVSKLSHWDSPLIVKDITKFYGGFKAVDSVSFSVRPGECFGLLGVNGAGKTSTFQMLTGEELVSSGDAHICGTSVRNDWRKAGRNVGYCPQFDALIDQMTGLEAVCMYARLRGVPESQVHRIAKAVIEAVGITKYANIQARTYSGGNKRRLSLAIALISGPTVLLLDEPTTGVDPTARRIIWNVLAQIRQQGTAIVLTSHSMEECEALCSRLAIMVAGNFKCLGTPQRLKSKYGLGYTLHVKTARIEDIKQIDKDVRILLPEIILKEVHHTQLSYELPSTSHTWSELFANLESLAMSSKLVDYSLSQTTLEQIFLSFSNSVNRDRAISLSDHLPTALLV